MNALRVALRIISGKIILNFGVQKRLRAFLNPIFTDGVVKENGSYKKSPHDTDLKPKDNRGSLWGALEDTPTLLPKAVLCSLSTTQEASLDASIAQENVKNKCQLERMGSKERTLSDAPPRGSCRAATEGL